jgi:predicted dinucleotide-binding enzyme
MLVAGDDADAKAIVMRLSAETGFSPIDAGGLAMSHWLESFAWLWISLAMKHGRDIAFRLMLR